ncbi:MULTISPECIES: glycoside hydrolase family protein [unclassified Kitasatospora]|uniref:glycoside hydrolase family protein n=1 Tax=unclassified Kitasatospora TaxID=2633591 RepID=UPI0034371787
MPRRMRLFTALLAVLTCLTVGSAADATAAPAKKKGVSAWNFTDVTKALADSRAGWFYTWASDRQQIKPPAGVEFVPMIWGAGSVTDAQLRTARQEGTTLLGFNEPDLSAQANMSVARALDLWPRLQSTGMRLGAPAVAGGGDVAGGWLDQFMKGAAARHDKVDFIPLHWYGSDFRADAATGQLRNYLQAVYNRYKKPIWLTEYALIDFSSGTPKYPTPEQQAAFVTKSTAMLQGLPFAERYAWFTLSADRGGTGLYNRATPNRVGTAYRAAG